MICLRFKISNSFYGLDCTDIIEVVPRIGMTAIVGAPDYVPGYFNYRGKIVPVADVSMLVAGQAAPERLSSRIAIVRFGAERCLGLLLEGATEVIVVDDAAITTAQSSGILTEADFMGRIIVAGGETMQLIKVMELLPEEVRNTVFMG